MFFVRKYFEGTGSSFSFLKYYLFLTIQNVRINFQLEKVRTFIFPTLLRVVNINCQKKVNISYTLVLVCETKLNNLCYIYWVSYNYEQLDYETLKYVVKALNGHSQKTFNSQMDLFEVSQTHLTVTYAS